MTGFKVDSKKKKKREVFCFAFNSRFAFFFVLTVDWPASRFGLSSKSLSY